MSPSALAAPPGTLLTTGELERAGLSQAMRRQLLRRGDLETLTRGVYRIPDRRAATAATNPFQKARADHLTRAAAILLTVPGAYLVGPSACLALKLPVSTVPSTVHLSRTPRARLTRHGVTARRPWSHAIETVDALAAQTASAAVIEVAAAGDPTGALMAADAAARRGMLSDLDTALLAWGARRGAVAARAVARLADGRRESPLESEAAWQAHIHRIPLEPQTVIRDESGGFVARADFTVPGYRIIVEVDGLGKYSDVTDIHRERHRQHELESLGWIVVRLTAADIRAWKVADILRQAMAKTERKTHP